jgi:3-oxoacyl-[acyl-carrier-protein] synthase-1
VNPQDVNLVGAGAATSVGRGWHASCAAQRAGLAGFVAHPFAPDVLGQAVRVAPAPWLTWGTDAAARLAALLVDAVEEALQPLAGPAPDLRCGLVLALPAPRPGLPLDLVEQTCAALRRGLEFRGLQAPPVLASLAQGHAAGFAALRAAAQALHDGRADACIVAGADSWLEPDTLAWLESCARLHGAGALNDPWGRVPGEAGAALLLCTQRTCAQLRLPTLARLASVGLGSEPCTAAGNVCTGAGLTQALSGALAALPDRRRVDDVVCDMNGERDRANEFAFTALRFADRLRSASGFIAPADTWGDVGAASAPLCVAAAAMAGLKGYAAGPWVLVWGGSDGPLRGAALFERRPAGH